MEKLRKAIQIVGSATGSLLNFEQKKQSLKRKLEELESREIDINTELEHAESSSGKKRRNEVENWLVNVARIRNEVQSIEEKVGFSGWSTALGSHLENMTEEVARLIDKGRFQGGLLLDTYDIEGDLLLTTKMVGQKFQRNMDDILACLTNDEISRIGIYGMGGVGKTALVTQIHNRIKANPNTLGSVYWVTISQDFSIYRLQSLIADTLKINISEENDEKKRAAKLSKILGRKRKCILILDDLWKHFCLEEVGIPVKISGCKLILTSRSVEVCRRMDCEEQIKVDTLSEEEAWNLFLEKLGHEIPHSLEIKKIAECVVKECAGLPLGIITVAGSMKGVDEVSEWRNALRELKESEIWQDDMEEKVFRVLRFSYNRLKNQPLEQSFLYCGLFPEDYMIKREELIEYLIVEGIIEGMSSRQAQFDRGHVMLNKLENVSLLEGINDASSVRYVKMHDLIRDMALQIMKLGPQETLIQGGKQLREIPAESKYWTKDVVRISLMHNNIREIPSTFSPTCSNLLTLLLRGNWLLIRIANSFFNYFPGLKVLDISETGIRKLPDSVGSLENLTALLLHRCYALTEVASLAKLGTLKKLDLYCTGLKELPEGAALLHNLTYLNLLGAGIMNLPPCIFSKMSRLQYFGFCCTSETSKVAMEEVAWLQKLEKLMCWFEDYEDYNSIVRLLSRRPLSKFYISVGRHSERYGRFPYDGNLMSREVWFEKNLISKEIYLPSNTLKLSFNEDRLEDGKALCLKNAIGLESLTVKKCEIKECLFDSSSSPLIPLPPNAAFSNLKSFQMYDCHSMKQLFHPSLIRNLRNMEVLKVSVCPEMEEIIAAEAEGGGIRGSSYNHLILTQAYEFILPKLRVLMLDGLLKLKRICSGTMICNSLQQIEILGCEKLENIPLALPLPSLEEIKVYPPLWWESVEWNHSIDKSVIQPFCKIGFY